MLVLKEANQRTNLIVRDNEIYQPINESFLQKLRAWSSRRGRTIAVATAAARNKGDCLFCRDRNLELVAA